MLNNRNDVLVPKYTASASLNGELDIAPVDTSLSVALIPFMRGEKGEQGARGEQGNDGVGIDNFTADPLAIYLISRG